MKSIYNNIKVLVKSGDLVSLETWQAIYRLQVGSEQIGKFFTLKESRFQRDIAEFGGLIVNAPLMMVTDEYRRLTGVSTILSSYNRNDEKQLQLLKEEEDELRKSSPEERKKVKKLRADVSPHVVKMAEDIDVQTREQVRERVPILRKAAKNVNVKIRIGHRLYLSKSEQVERLTGVPNTWTFIHADVCPEFYAKGMAFHSHPHPEPWERVTEW